MAIVLKTISDSKEAQADIAKLRNSVEGIQQSVNKVSESFLNFSKVIAASLAGAAAIQSFTRYSDELTNLDSKLKLVTNSQEELNFALKSIRITANATRGDLGTITTLYTKLARAGQDFGASQADVAKATQLVSKTITISGGTAQEANAAVLQLGQALASGRLAGDELRSILENAPPLAQAIAKGLGVSIGKLRELGEAGVLSSSKVFQAILKQQGEIEKNFTKVNITYGQAFQNLGNSLSILFAEIKNATIGSGGGFAKAINDIADSIFRFAMNFRIALLSAKTDVALFITKTILSFYSLWDTLDGTSDKIKLIAKDLYETWQPTLRRLSQEIIYWSKTAVMTVSAVSVAIYNAFKNTDFGAGLVESFKNSIGKVRTVLVSVFNSITSKLPKIDVNKFIPGLDVALTYIRSWAEKAEGWFFWLYDKVIGRSWIPDLVSGVTAWLSKLNQKPLKMVAAFADKANLSFAGIKINAPFIAGIGVLVKYRSALYGLLGILGLIGAAVAGIKLFDNNKLELSLPKASPAEKSQEILTKSLDWLKKIQSSVKESFNTSTFGRTIKQVLGIRDTTPGMATGVAIDTSAYVGRGPQRRQEVRTLGHDIINALPREIQTPLIAAFTGIFAIAIIRAFEAGPVRNILLGLLTTAATVFASKVVRTEDIRKTFGDGAFTFLKILEKGVTSIFSGNVLKDPLFVLSTVAKTALLFEAGRAALGRAAVGIATAPTRLAQTATSILERSLLNRDVTKSQRTLQELPNRLQQVLIDSRNEARNRNRALANLTDASGNQIGTARARAAIVAGDTTRFGTTASTAAAMAAVQARSDLNSAIQNLRNLPQTQARLNESITESNRRSTAITETLRQQGDAFRAGIQNVAGGAGGILGGLAGFQIGTEIAKGMTDSPGWAKVGVALAISFAGQAVGAGIGAGIVGILTGSISLLGTGIATAFGAVAGGIGTIIASPILLAVAAFIAAGAILANWDSLVAAGKIVANFISSAWSDTIFPKLNTWSSELAVLLRNASVSFLSGKTGDVENTTVAAGGITAGIVGLVAYLTRNLTGLSTVFQNAGPAFSTLFARLQRQIAIYGWWYAYAIRDFATQQLPVYLRNFLNLLTSSNFGQAIFLVLQDIKNAFSSVWASIRNSFLILGPQILSSIPDWVKNVFSAVRLNLKGPAIVAIASALIAGIYSIIKDILDAFKTKNTDNASVINGQSINVEQIPTKATGGWINGPGTGTSDSIPAMLSNGEFVVNAKAARENWDILNAINNGGSVSRLVDGGPPRGPNALPTQVRRTPQQEFRALENKALIDSQTIFEKFLNLVKQLNKKLEDSIPGFIGKPSIPGTPADPFAAKKGDFVKLLEASNSSIESGVKAISAALSAKGFQNLDAKALRSLAVDTPDEFKRIADLLDKSAELLSKDVGQSSKLSEFIRNQNRLLANQNLQDIGKILSEKRIAETPSKYATQPDAIKLTEITFGEQLNYINRAFPELNLTTKDLLKISDDVRENMFKNAVEITRITGEIDKIVVGTVEGGVKPQALLARTQEAEIRRREKLGQARQSLKPFKMPYEDFKATFEEIGQTISEETFNLLEDTSKSALTDLVSKISAQQAILKTPGVTEDVARETQIRINEYLANVRKVIDSATDYALNDFDKYKKTLDVPTIDFDKRSFNLLLDNERIAIKEYASKIKENEEKMKGASEERRIALQTEIDGFYDMINKIVSSKARDFKTPAQLAGEAFVSSIKEGFTSAFRGLLKKETKDENTSVWVTFRDRFLDNLTNNVIDTFASGLMNSFTGKDSTLMKSISGLGGSVSELGGKAVSWLGGLFGGSSATAVSEMPSGPLDTTQSSSEMQLNDYLDPAATVTKTLDTKIAGIDFGNIFGGIKDFLGKVDFGGIFGTIKDFLGKIDFGSIFKVVGDLFSKVDFGGVFGTITKFFGFADGGKVYGAGTGTSDSIPAMLSNGEFVINAKSAKKFEPLLTAINNSSFAKFAAGGLVSTAMVATPVIAQPEQSTTIAKDNSQQIINISITGDISRQTRSEIYKMLPNIANGVNTYNKEKGYKG